MWLWGTGRQDQAGSWQRLRLEEFKVTSASLGAPGQPEESHTPPANARIQPHTVPEVCPGVQHPRKICQWLCSTHTQPNPSGASTSSIALPDSQNT